MNHRVALAAVTAFGAALATPAVSSAQAPTLPVSAPSLPAPSLPPGSSTDPVTGVVTTVTGVVLGVLDPITGQIIPAPAPSSPPATPPEEVPDTGTGPSGQTPATGSTTTPKTGESGAAKDTTKPRLQIRVDRKTSYQTAQRSGIRVVARCSETCTTTLRVLRGKQVGRKRMKMLTMRTYVVKVRLNRRGKAVTARSRTATKLRVTGRAVDTAGNLSKTVKKTAYVRAAKRR